MNYYDDPYEGGNPKYSTAKVIRDELHALANPEEVGIVQEMFPDVSWQNQDFIYTQKAERMLERFDGLSGYGKKMWLMDLAAVKLDGWELHATVWKALRNANLANRIGLKEVITEKLMYGYRPRCKGFIKEWAEATEDLLLDDDYDYDCDYDDDDGGIPVLVDKRGMSIALNAVLDKRGIYRPENHGYFAILDGVSAKLDRAALADEMFVISAARDLLTSRDDYLHGLRVNQRLYGELEGLFKDKVKKLQEAYDAQVAALLRSAEAQGVVLRLGAEAKLLVGLGDVVDAEFCESVEVV